MVVFFFLVGTFTLHPQNMVSMSSHCALERTIKIDQCVPSDRINSQNCATYLIFAHFNRRIRLTDSH